MHKLLCIYLVLFLARAAETEIYSECMAVSDADGVPV